MVRSTVKQGGSPAHPPSRSEAGGISGCRGSSAGGPLLPSFCLLSSQWSRPQCWAPGEPLNLLVSDASPQKSKHHTWIQGLHVVSGTFSPRQPSMRHCRCHSAGGARVSLGRRVAQGVSLSATDLWGQRLVSGRPVRCQMFNDISGLYPLDGNSPVPSVTAEISRRCPPCLVVQPPRASGTGAAVC